MKKAIKTFSLLFAIYSLLLCTCSSGGESAVISINLGSGSIPAKVARDVSISELKHIITFSGPTGTQIVTITGGGTAKATVMPGHWNISVEAYLGDELYAIGSASTEVRAGKTSNVTVQMTVVWGNDGSPSQVGTVSPGITVSVSPDPAYVKPGGSLQFTADIDGTVTTDVTWSVSGTKVSGTSATDIDTSGLLSVDPMEPLTTVLTVKAVSNAYPLKSGTADVTVSNLTGSVGILEQDHTGDDIGKVYINTVLVADLSGLVNLPLGETPTYQWLRNSTIPIPAPDGTGSTYTVVSGDVGDCFTVEVDSSLGSVTSGTSATVVNLTGIYNLDQLAGIDTDYTTRGGNYILLVDLNLSSYSGTWTPLCNESDQFRGTFDGNGKTINLGTNKIGTVGVSVNSYAGLFGYISDSGPGILKNFKLEGTMIVTGPVGPINFFVGAAAGRNYGNIMNVVSNVAITANGSDSINAGGITGANVTNSITNCYSTGMVTANGGDYSLAGGIVGDNSVDNHVINCWASGNVTSGLGYTRINGGIAGTTRNEGDVSYCVALNSIVNNVSGTSGRVIGLIDPVGQGTYSGGTASDNFANRDMLVNGTALPYTTGSANDEDGEDVGLATEANDRNWWNITAGWNVQLEQGMTSESTPWYWGTGTRPRLWFE